MAGITTQLYQMKNAIEDFKVWARARIDAQQTQIEELENRLSRYDRPQKPGPGTKTGERANPIPIPDRPDVMEAANVGKDPRR